MTTPAAGEAANDDAGDDPGGDTLFSLRGGHTMSINMAALRALYPVIRHHPAVLAALDAKVTEMGAAANALATTQGAQYKTTLVSDWPDSSRARANVWTGNRAAREDDAHNSTLLKVIAQFHGEAAT